MTKLKYLLQSRKFWACVAAIAAAISGAVAGETTWATAIYLIIASLNGYGIGVALDKGGTQ